MEYYEVIYLLSKIQYLDGLPHFRALVTTFLKELGKRLEGRDDALLQHIANSFVQ
jgi:hypothetical protein